MPPGLKKLAQRGWGTSPGAIARWLLRQAKAELDQLNAPRRARRLDRDSLLRTLGENTLDDVWAALARGPYPACFDAVDGDGLDSACPGEREKVMAAAKDVLARRVDLLGSGPVDLGTPIDWHRDFKSGHAWPLVPFRRIDVLDLGRDSDIKVPWELSRLQWLIPAGQAYLLTGDDQYATAVKAVVLEWMDANPVARGVNWACTMDVALRAITLSWLFHVFHAAQSWRDIDFRFRFIHLLYTHGQFICRHLEWSDVNGNHLLADAAGLVFLGLFFARRGEADGWQKTGWGILCDQLPRQVHGDGVGFEASAAYHRLGLELFHLPACYRKVSGLAVDDGYRQRLIAMAAFTAAYTRPDGSAPHWGDADDGRVLPLGGHGGRHDINDHRYLMGVVGTVWEDDETLRHGAGPRAEVFWLCGAEAASRLPSAPPPQRSRAFAQAGVYIMASDTDHVFIDCGSVGMAGRGGHGHNDCLSFEAVLDSVPLITDCGAYVYSASVEWRNRFRATAFHNTPMIDGEEQNRFLDPTSLFSLRDDATPRVRKWEAGKEQDILVAEHQGYARLADPIHPVRGFLLEKAAHRLVISDHFEGPKEQGGKQEGKREGKHGVSIPFHLAPGVSVDESRPGCWTLTAEGKRFDFSWVGAGDWETSLEEGWHSPSYGIKVAIQVIRFHRQGPLKPLTVTIEGEESAAKNIGLVQSMGNRAETDMPSGEMIDAVEETPERPVRVLINGLHSKSGGGVTYLRNMLPLLARDPGLEVHLCVHQDQRHLLPDDMGGITCHFLSFDTGFWTLLVREQWEIPRLARRIGADVTFSPANYAPLLASPSVILLRNALGVAFVERRPVKIGYWAMLYLGTLISLLFSRRAIAVSQYARRSVGGGPMAFLRRKVSVIPHGVGTEFALSQADGGREDFLLAVSDIYIQKNLKNLILAVSRLKEDQPQILLKIAGRPIDAEYFASLQSLVAHEGLEGNVEFLGQVSPKDLAGLYRRCGVFVFPSSVESFGNPLLEAMASGAAIASSNAAAMPEVAGNGALYFDPGNVGDMVSTIGRLMTDDELRRSLAARANLRAKGFSWRQTACQTVAVIRQAAS